MSKSCTCDDQAFLLLLGFVFFSFFLAFGNGVLFVCLSWMDVDENLELTFRLFKKKTC